MYQIFIKVECFNFQMFRMFSVCQNDVLKHMNWIKLLKTPKSDFSKLTNTNEQSYILNGNEMD